MFRSLVTKFGPQITRTVARRAVVQRAPQASVLTSSFIRNSSTAVTLTDEEKDAAWVAYFDNPELDYFDFCIGFMDLWQDDVIPEPVILQSALYACRRLNNFPVAIRCLELVRLKCRDRKEVYDYILQELGPTFEDLGLKTPEQLGLDQVSD